MFTATAATDATILSILLLLFFSIGGVLIVVYGLACIAEAKTQDAQSGASVPQEGNDHRSKSGSDSVPDSNSGSASEAAPLAAPDSSNQATAIADNGLKVIRWNRLRRATNIRRYGVSKSLLTNSKQPKRVKITKLVDEENQPAIASDNRFTVGLPCIEIGDLGLENATQPIKVAENRFPVEMPCIDLPGADQHLVEKVAVGPQLAFTPEGRAAISAILALNGVYSVRVSSFDIWVEIAPAFNWALHHEAIIKILTADLFGGAAHILAPPTSLGLNDAYGWGC